MDPRLHPPTLIISLVLLAISSCVCQIDQQYQNCSQTLLQCGNNRDIGYPFWGGNRPASCGYPGFELDCQDDILHLNISSTTYRVLSINNRTQTLRVARDDLWDNVCPTYPSNTTLNFTIFDYLSTANDQNITLRYGCGVNQLPTDFPLYSFYCNVNGTNRWNFVRTGNSGQGNRFACNSVISVTVNQTSAQVLGLPNPNASTIPLLDAIMNGFSIQWSANNDNCNICVRSGGVCGYNQTFGSFSCYCSNRSHEFTCDNNNQNQNGNGVSIGVAGIVVSTIIVIYVRKQCRLRKLDQESNQNVNKILLADGSLAPKRYNYREIKKITKSFTDKLGEGGYGIVYKGKLPDGQFVAVKVLTETDKDGEEFINEVASISRTSHVNIVNLLGFCHERKKRALVYEYMPNKSLDKFIYKSGSEAHLEQDKLYDIAIGIARGLEYLHRGCNTRIIHFDIKPQNILLDEDFCPKISDFGLAKLCKRKHSMISMLGTRGTIGYIAPEVVSRNFGRVSYKSDVYSYGMMLLEMAEVRENVDIETIQSSEGYFPDKIYKHVLLGNKSSDDLMTEVNVETAQKMLLVGLWCIQTAPSDRPSMTKVVEMLEGSLQSIQIPPKPVLSSSRLSALQFSSSFSVIVEAENSTESSPLPTSGVISTQFE